MRLDHKDISSFVLEPFDRLDSFPPPRNEFSRNQPWRERKLAICRIAGIVLHRFEYFPPEYFELVRFSKDKGTSKMGGLNGNGFYKPAERLACRSK